MAYKVQRSRACRQDLQAIFDHLFTAYLDLGDALSDALDRAEKRLARIEDDIDALGTVPHRGTLWPEVMDGLRWVTIDRATFYFTVDADRQKASVLAIFFGGQDHRAHVLNRIRAGRL